MKIKKATIENVKLLAKIFDDYRIFYKKTSDLAGAQDFLKERVANNESEIFIAENEENAIVGFVQLYPIFSSTRMQRLWLLNDLYVDEKYRGHGISVALINAAKNLCYETNACGIILETEKTNDIGNILYPKTGFILDLAHNYYSWDVA